VAVLPSSSSKTAVDVTPISVDATGKIASKPNQQSATGKTAVPPRSHGAPKKRSSSALKQKSTPSSIKNGKMKVKHSKLEPDSEEPKGATPILKSAGSPRTQASSHRPVSVHFSSPTCTTFSEPALHLAASPVGNLKCDATTQTRPKRRGKKRCCKWMLAATLRSCFGPCFKRLGTPSGYDSIEDSPGAGEIDNFSGISKKEGRRLENGYDSVETPFHSRGLDYRSKSTSEIFRSNDFYYTDFMKPDKRSFSASFGYLNDNDLFESLSQGMRSTLTSANDLRSDMSEAFWSCRGSLSRSSTHLDSEQDFYSDESEEPHEEEYTVRSVCELCGSAGKDHHYDEHDKGNWRETSLTSSLPIPKSQKWIQLD